MLRNLSLRMFVQILGSPASIRKCAIKRRTSASINRRRKQLNQQPNYQIKAAARDVSRRHAWVNIAQLKHASFPLIDYYVILWTTMKLYLLPPPPNFSLNSIKLTRSQLQIDSVQLQLMAIQFKTCRIEEKFNSNAPNQRKLDSIGPKLIKKNINSSARHISCKQICDI